MTVDIKKIIKRVAKEKFSVIEPAKKLKGVD
jgi:hypothetical protein